MSQKYSFFNKTETNEELFRRLFRGGNEASQVKTHVPDIIKFIYSMFRVLHK